MVRRKHCLCTDVKRSLSPAVKLKKQMVEHFVYGVI